MSSCHSFYSNSNENEFQEKDNRHPKDHATAATGSRSFSGTFSSCTPLYTCDLSHSKKHHLMILIIKKLIRWCGTLYPSEERIHTILLLSYSPFYQSFTFILLCLSSYLPSVKTKYIFLLFSSNMSRSDRAQHAIPSQNTRPCRWPRKDSFLTEIVKISVFQWSRQSQHTLSNEK